MLSPRLIIPCVNFRDHIPTDIPVRTIERANLPDEGMETPSSLRFPAFDGNSGNGNLSSYIGSRESAELPKELEFARPQTAGEEELQLQLALDMPREVAEQLALSQSQQDFKVHQYHSGKQNVNLNEPPTDPCNIP
ncbi:hypothetical protein FQA39_LY00961 [Lamprigera yunnana]|nr:hypothetical protein FQA39_LY00961 [Lamprigera yunnana]